MTETPAQDPQGGQPPLENGTPDGALPEGAGGGATTGSDSGSGAAAALTGGLVAAGLGAGGATIDDFRHADGVRGRFQDEFLVHRRRGEPCKTCGREIVKFVAAGRGTYVCEGCQKRPRALRHA